MEMSDKGVGDRAGDKPTVIRTRLQMMCSMMECTNFTKAYIPLKISYSSTLERYMQFNLSKREKYSIPCTDFYKTLSSIMCM
jgi:hypothetical protein